MSQSDPLPEDGPTDVDAADLQEQIEALRKDMQSLREGRQAYREHVIKPRFEAISDARDDAREERAELRQQINALTEQVHRLQTKVENLIGLADDEVSNPDKRAADLAQALIRRAEDRSDENQGRASMYWKEVQNLFSDLGHGDISRPDCYKAMDDVAQRPGFDEGTKTSRDGNSVKAVTVDLDELAAETACSNPTTPEGLSSTQNRRTTGGESNHD